MKLENPFLRALKTYRTILMSTIVLSIAINALMFISPLYMLQVYDRVLHSRNETTLLMITMIATIMLGIYGLLEWIRSRVLVRAGLRFDEMISKGLFNRVVTSTLKHPQGRPEFVLSDIDRLREFLTGSGVIALCDLPWMPVFLIVCFLFHPLVGLIATVGALISFALAIANEFTTKKPLTEASGHGQAAQYFANSTLQNVEIIRALGMQNNLRGRWSGMHRSMLEKQAVASDRAGILMSASKFVRMTLQTVILGAGAYLAIEGSISAGSMIACSILMGRALGPVDAVVGQWKQFIGARQAYRRLNQIFENIPEEAERTALPKPKGYLTAEQLVIAAPGAKSALLNGVSFSLNPGEAMALVGPSGTGKSSLVRALVGVWQPVAGAIRLDGAELQHWNPQDLGDHLGYLPQTVELFAGTIAENIGRFRPNVPAEDVIKAAMQSRVHQMIQNLPDGYDTQIGVGGRQLSGGQRQRIGLARALFGEPAVVILDEPNANLDSEGEEALFQVIAELKAREKVIIFVSHKMSLVTLSDKTLILSDGRMRSFGLTRDLLQPQQQPMPAPAPAPIEAAAGSAAQNRNIA
jgi:PrtD family type I secretion system ABC transporter